ncbi:MAG: sensor histidine kinase [Polyangiales bacterium]
MSVAGSGNSPTSLWPRQPLLSPAQLLRRLWWRSAAALGIVVMLGAVWMLPVLALDPTAYGGVLRLTATLLSAAWLAIGLTAAHTVFRCAPIYRTLLRHGMASGAPALPPSAAALCDAYRAPAQLGLVLGPLACLLLALDALAWASLSGLSGTQAWALDLYLLALVLVCIPLTSLTWRATLWNWLGRITPAQVQVPVRAVLRRQLWLRIGVLLAALMCVALALCLAALGPKPWSSRAWLAVALVALAALGALGWGASAARQLGGQVADDLLWLARRVRSLRNIEVSGVQTDPGTLLSRPLRTASARQLASAIHGLTRGYADLAAEEARACREVAEAQRIKTRFMALMSHDLRSPLNSILGFADLLESGSEGALNQAQRESLSIIRHSGEELLALITATLDWARLEAGRLTFYPDWVPVVEVLTCAAQSMASLTAHRTVQVQRELQPGLPPVFVDSARTVQALSSVLRSLCQVAPPGTVLGLRAWARSLPRDGHSHVRVDIEDRSQSLPETVHREVSAAFDHAPEDGPRAGTALDLNLSLARLLLQGQGGTLRCHDAHESSLRLALILPTEAPGRWQREGRHA